MVAAFEMIFFVVVRFLLEACAPINAAQLQATTVSSMISRCLSTVLGI